VLIRNNRKASVIESATNACLRQNADQLSTWKDDLCVHLNTEKFWTTLFTLSPKQKRSRRAVNISYVTPQDKVVKCCNLKQSYNIPVDVGPPCEH